jgi:hypothetical protein
MVDFSIGGGWQAQPAGLDHDFLDFDAVLLAGQLASREPGERLPPLGSVGIGGDACRRLRAAGSGDGI